MLNSIFAVFFALQAHAQILETPDLESCLKPAARASASYDPHDVIYVFDIDNTVLSLGQNLGSVQWFHWQQKLIKDDIKQDRVASSTDELLKHQGLIYQLSSTRTPEPSTASELLGLQQRGHSVLFHTSRSVEVRDVTETELKNNGLIPLMKTIGPKNGYAGQFNFIDGPAGQRPVSFQNGVYMSVGQDKGVWLKFLLDKTSRAVKHLVFVDDELKNLQNVERVFQGSTPMTLCRYGKVDDVVRKFHDSDKSAEAALWREVQGLLARFR